MYLPQAKNGQQSIVKKQTQISEENRIKISSPLPLLFSLPYDSTFLPGRGKAISRSHTWTYINITTTQSTQRAYLWETSGPAGIVLHSFN